jgi:hypothetical protein
MQRPNQGSRKRGRPRTSGYVALEFCRRDCAGIKLDIYDNLKINFKTFCHN